MLSHSLGTRHVWVCSSAWSPLASARWGTHGQRKTLCQQQCHGRCLHLASNCSLPLLASLSGEPAVAAARGACSKGRSKHCSAQGLGRVQVGLPQQWWGCPSSGGTACPAPLLRTLSGVAAESVSFFIAVREGRVGGIKRDCGGGECCPVGNQQDQGAVASLSLGQGQSRRLISPRGWRSWTLEQSPARSSPAGKGEKGLEMEEGPCPPS